MLPFVRHARPPTAPSGRALPRLRGMATGTRTYREAAAEVLRAGTQKAVMTTPAQPFEVYLDDEPERPIIALLQASNIREAELAARARFGARVLACVPYHGRRRAAKRRRTEK